MATTSAHDDPPEYSESSGATRRRTERSEHSYSLENSKGRRWLSLSVNSRSASAQLLPLYYEADTISGRVDLDLDNSEVVKEITISIEGIITLVGHEEKPFLQIDHDIWNPGLENPTDAKASPSSKLKGQHVWPFSIQLPTHTNVKDSKYPGTFKMPPSISGRTSPAFIDYKIILTVKKPALRVNQTLTTNFGYIPLSTHDAPSSLRQLAYRQRTQPPGPKEDPDGWRVLPPVKITGTLFDVRKADIQCTLAIATPLCCALGFSLPLMLTLTGSDPQALDILATPSGVRLNLVRSLAFGSEATKESGRRRSSNYFRERVGSAMFWSTGAGSREDGKRVLQGEISVGKSLKPTFTFPRFAIGYSLDLLLFDAPGFAFDGQPQDTLMTESVTIATTPPPGSAQLFHAPPRYVQPQHGDQGIVGK